MRLYKILPLYIIVTIFLYLKKLYYQFLNYKFKKKYNIPIYSIGSIELGGSGKTTLTKALVSILIGNGYKPGILSRGYKRKSHRMQVVHNGQKLLTNVMYAGDEPYMLGKLMKKVPIIVDKNKERGIVSLSNYNVDCIVIDDGYQSHYLGKKKDIIIINNFHDISNYLIFPYGFLREPIHFLKRADIVLFNENKNKKLESNIKKHLSQKIKIFIYKRNYFLHQYKSIDIFSPINNIKGNFIAFCGIALPELFFEKIKDYNVSVKKCFIYNNHQNYNHSIINSIIKNAEKLKIKQFITTDKDVFKLPPYLFRKYSIYTLSTNIVIEDEKNFIKSLLN